MLDAVKQSVARTKARFLAMSITHDPALAETRRSSVDVEYLARSRFACLVKRTAEGPRTRPLRRRTPRFQAPLFIFAFPLDAGEGRADLGARATANGRTPCFANRAPCPICLPLLDGSAPAHQEPENDTVSFYGRRLARRRDGTVEQVYSYDMRHDQAVIRAAEVLATGGRRLADVAKELTVPLSTIQRWSARLGWFERRSHRATVGLLVRRGYTLAEAAAEVAVPLSTVQKWSAADKWTADTPVRGRRRVIAYRRAQQLVRQGQTLREAAKLAGVPVSTAEKWSARDGWRRS